MKLIYEYLKNRRKHIFFAWFSYEKENTFMKYTYLPHELVLGREEKHSIDEFSQTLTSSSLPPTVFLKNTCITHNLIACTQLICSGQFRNASDKKCTKF